MNTRRENTFRMAKVLPCIVAIALLLNIFQMTQVSRSVSYIPPAPSKLDVQITVGIPDITYDAGMGIHHVVLEWQAPENDPQKVADEADNGSIIENGYRLFTSDDNVNFVQRQPAMPLATASVDITSNGPAPFKSGMVYYAYIKYYHKHKNGAEHESLQSHTAAFMTEINASVRPASTNALEIQWDDVRYNGQRIDYNIHISESKDFSKVTTLSIRQQNIGSSGPVIPVPAERKLSVTVKGSEYGIKPGTVYYVKIEPLVNDSTIRHKAESRIIVGYTKILAAISKISGSWWRLQWNGVTDSTLGSGQEVIYKIKRGNISEWDNPILVTIGETTDNKFQVSVTQNRYFYIITAEIKDQFGNQLHDGVQSGKLTAVEADVPAKPPVPELRDEIRTYYPGGTVVYRSDDPGSLKPAEFTVAWTPPRHPDGSIDDAVVYDIWLLTNPADLSNPYAEKYASEFIVPAADFIKVSEKTIAFRHTFTNLTPNTTYYLKIIAKKLYTVNQSSWLASVYYESDPALRVITTPGAGPLDQPPAPAKPPLGIKKLYDSNNIFTGFDIGKTSAAIEWKNKWKEKWNNTAGKWEYAEDNENAADAVYRTVIYDTGVTFRLGYALYKDNMDYGTLKSLPTQIVNLKNNISGVLQQYNLTGLKPNTAYVVWLRAYRDDISLLSEPSDPVVIVTKPDYAESTERPEVPRFSYGRAGDTFINLGWNIKPGYTYYLKYSTSDNISSAKDSYTFTPQDLQENPVISIGGLEQQTNYSFWIQADSTGKKKEEGLSLWSDSFNIKTLPFIPPTVPKGFGVGTVNKNSIKYVWTKAEGIEYVLQISRDITYKDYKEYKAGLVDTYTVDGLLSNYRYYARLYAVDSGRKLKSQPTESIIARTLRSNDEYDSDIDNEITVSESFIDETERQGNRTIAVTGANAERFIEKVQFDKILDYRFDLPVLTAGNAKNVLIFSNKVFRALSRLKEYIIIDLGEVCFTIKPGVFETDMITKFIAANSDANIELTVGKNDEGGIAANKDLTYVTGVFSISVNITKGNTVKPVKSFGRPVVATYTYGAGDIIEGNAAGCYYYNDDTGKWSRKDTTYRTDEPTGKLKASFNLDKPGKSAVLRNSPVEAEFLDISEHPGYGKIVFLYSRYNLASIKTGFFRPYDPITLEELIKLLFDLLEEEDVEDYAVAAFKAGFISARDVKNTGRLCTENDILKMFDRYYQIKTGKKAVQRNNVQASKKSVTRGDTMILLYNFLKEKGGI